MKTTQVPISEIKMGKFNPQSRTEPKRLKQLEESMIGRGFLPEFPIIVGNDGETIGDGHRRYSVARKLGFTHVPVIYSDLSAEDVYALQNEGKLKPNNSELLEASTLGIDIYKLPKTFQKHYANIIKYCGHNAIEYMVDRGLSPTQIEYVSKAIKYIQRQAPEIIIDTEYGFKVLQWMSSNNQSYRSRRFVEDGENVDRLIHAIDKNKPLPRL